MPENQKVFLKTKDYLVTQEAFDLVHDADTGLLITYPVPQDLQAYYNSNDYISHTDNRKGLLPFLYQTVKKIMLRQKYHLIRRLQSNTSSLLDIGAGTGDFLQYMKSKNWSVQGLEPNQQARKLAAQKHIHLFESFKTLDSTSVSVITMWHVLEHVPNLPQTLSLIHNHLNSQGHLIIAVPNYNSLDARYYKGHWAAYDTPRHLWHFNKHTITRLVTEHGFQHIRTKPMLFDSFYVSLLSEKYKKTIIPYLPAFIIGILSNFCGLFTKEYSSHIYIFQKV